MSLGLNVIDTAFEKLDMNAANSDSDEDETDTGYRTDPILEPKVRILNMWPLATQFVWRDFSFQN